MPRSFQWSLSLRPPIETLYALLLSQIRTTCSAQLIPLDLIARVNSVKSTDYKAPGYVVFSIPLLLGPVGPKYLSQHPILEHFQSHTHTKHEEKLQFCIS